MLHVAESVIRAAVVRQRVLAALDVLSSGGRVKVALVPVGGGAAELVADLPADGDRVDVVGRLERAAATGKYVGFDLVTTGPDGETTVTTRFGF